MTSSRSKLESAPRTVAFAPSESGGAEGNCEVSVYAAVDVSGSMAGPKATEVCEALQRIIDDCPDNVLFDITLFSTTTWKAATALKTGLNTGKLIAEIQTACGRKGMTALYDAWGNMLTSIPKAVLKNGFVKIFVLTDGEDNCSTKYDANSIVQLTKSIVGGNSKFDFIQVGKGGNAGIVSALKTLNTATGNNAFRSMVVDDSAKGIRSAMSTVHKDILLSTTSKNNPGNSTLKASATGSGQTHVGLTSGSTRNANPSSRGAASATATLSSIHEAKLIQSFSAADMMSTRKVGSTTGASSKGGAGPSSSRPGGGTSNSQAGTKKTENGNILSSTSSSFRLQ